VQPGLLRQQRGVDRRGHVDRVREPRVLWSCTRIQAIYPILELPIRVSYYRKNRRNVHQREQTRPPHLSPPWQLRRHRLSSGRKASLASRAAAATASRSAAVAASRAARAAGVAADVARAARLSLDLTCHPKSCSNRRFPTAADYEHLPGKPTPPSSLSFFFLVRINHTLFLVQGVLVFVDMGRLATNPSIS
jgi:hypothetical protein